MAQPWRLESIEYHWFDYLCVQHVLTSCAKSSASTVTSINHRLWHCVKIDILRLNSRNLVCVPIFYRSASMKAQLQQLQLPVTDWNAVLLVIFNVFGPFKKRLFENYFPGNSMYNGKWNYHSRGISNSISCKELFHISPESNFFLFDLLQHFWCANNQLNRSLSTIVTSI